MKILYISPVPHNLKTNAIYNEWETRTREDTEREREREEGRKMGGGWETFKVISFKSIVGTMSLHRTLLSATQTFLPSSHQFMHGSDKRAYWFCFGRITIGLSLVCGDRHHSKLIPYISYFRSQQNHALIYRFNVSFSNSIILISSTVIFKKFGLEGGGGCVYVWWK